MKKSVCQIFNKNCLETGLKPDIPTINAAALEYVKRFPLFSVPAVAFSDNDFDETIAAAKKPGFKSFTMKAKSKVILNVKMTVGESHNVAAWFYRHGLER